MSIVFKMDQSKEICVILNQSPDGKIVSFRVRKCADYKDADLVVPEGDVAIQCSGCREKTRISVAFQPIIKSEEFVVVDFVASPAQDFDWPDDESAKEEQTSDEIVITIPLEIMKEEANFALDNNDIHGEPKLIKRKRGRPRKTLLDCTVKPKNAPNSELETVVPKQVTRRGRKRRDKEKEESIDKSVICCKLCDKNFIDLSSLKEHNLEKHKSLWCSVCFKSFKSKVGYEIHLRNHLPLSCGPCSLTFKSSEEREIHERTVHQSVIKMFNCNICSIRCWSEKALKVHVKMDHEKNFCCDICNAKLVTKVGMLRHMNRHEGIKNFMCEKCGMSFRRRMSLRNHEQIHREPFRCFYCPTKKFTWKKTILKHMQKYHMILDDIPFDFVCHKCPKRLQFKWQLKNHIKSSHSTVRVPCPLCKREYDKINLKAHMKTHQSLELRKTFSCNICGISLTSKFNLEDHLKMHRGEVKFECRWCGKKNSRKSNHLRHERIHTGERPYECPEPTCDKKFRDGDSQRCHFRTVHTSIKPYKCPIEECSKRFSDRGCYRSHLLVHERKLGIILVKSLREMKENNTTE